MAAIDFPSSPTDGQFFVAGNGVVYQWSAAKGLWLSTGATGLVAAPTLDEWSVGSASGSAFWAGGDTAMQITNGIQIFNRSFTASNSAHPIEVDATVYLQAPNSTAAHGVVGLFIDGAAAAVAHGFVTAAAGSATHCRVYWQGVLAPGPHTFMLRVGSLNTSGIYTIMSDAGHAGGGAMYNSMVIREIGVGPRGPVGPVGVLTNPSIYDRLTTAQPADPGGVTYGIPMTITQGSQVPWPGGAIKTFTAADATRPIEVDVTLIVGAGAATIQPLIALFIDGATNSVQQSIVGLFAQAMAGSRLLWRGVLSAGPHTFQVRWSGGSSGCYLLRNDATVLTGSGNACTIAIREVAD